MSYPESLRCDDCGRHHQLDASIPSEIWNKIASDVSLLCIDCIDARAVRHGVKFEAEFYWTGTAGLSRMYENSYGDQQAALTAIRAEDAHGRYECVVCGEPWPDGVESCPRVSTCDGYRWFNRKARAEDGGRLREIAERESKAAELVKWLRDYARSDFEERCNTGTLPIHWNTVVDSELWNAAELIQSQAAQIAAMREALEGIDTFAWSACMANCEEAREEAMRRITACRNALSAATAHAATPEE